MKVAIKIAVILCLLHLTACDGMDSLHEKYLEQGEAIYTGVIDSLKAYPGNNRVKFTWEINSDPRIRKTVIYWNERQDSSTVQANRTGFSGRLPMETTMDIPEGNYIFEFVTRDDEEHHSMFVEQTVQVYGEKLIETLRNRSIRSISAEDAEATVEWFPIDDLTVQYTTVRYTDHPEAGNPVRKAVRIENDETETRLPHVRPGDLIEVISTHLPDNGLDRIDALPKEYRIP
ncbi:MAG: DUF4998 domain-containing protein [Tannerella sp.]|jgi:hypothetical protein|nr:DUF4998 domain-containing protein [Tannerella sp.]